MVLFHMIYKTFPFSTNSNEDELCKSENMIEEFEKDETKNKFKVKASDALKKLLQSLLKFNPEERPTILYLKSNLWF